MKQWFKAVKDNYTRDKARRRLSRVGDVEVIDWAETTINAFHFQLDAYRRNKDAVATDDLHKCLLTLQGAVDVLESRTTN